MGVPGTAPGHPRLPGHWPETCSGETIAEPYEPTAGRSPLSIVWTWLRDPARWRDLAYLVFSLTGGGGRCRGALVLPIAALLTYLTMPLWLGWEWRR